MSATVAPDGPRPLHVIADDIRAHWPRVHYSAAPYLDAMASLDGIDGQYGADSAVGIVLRFLSNASTWRGEDAKRIKAELKKMIGRK